MSNYHPFITGANRTLRSARGVNVFGPGTDPAGLGTLGAPVNTAHVFDYLGENLPPFGNPQDIVGADSAGWEQGFEQVYGGKIVTAEQDRFNPNTTTYTISDANPVVSRPDELTVVRNNAQIMADMVKTSARTYRANPQADALAEQVNADAEMRNAQNEAVGLVYESQMDALRANHMAAKSRGSVLRGESIGAMVDRPTTKVSRLALKPMTTSKVTLPATKSMPVISAPAAASPAASESSGADFLQVTMGGGETISEYPITDDGAAMATYVDTRFEPTKVALVLGGVAVAAVAAFFFMRRK